LQNYFFNAKICGMSQNTTIQVPRGRPVGTGAASSGAVREVRRALGWTQEKLARELNCTLGAVRAMERGNRLPGSGAIMEGFNRLAKRANVSLEARAEEVSA
jgi:DNA-binding transcriptional regulator YiaG